MSVLSNHIANWQGCTRCALHKVRKNVVFYRGKIPAEVAYVGEAPGDSEDVNGIPFCGPAGILLNEIIAKAEQDANVHPLSVFSNVVACCPKDLNPSRKEGEPLPEEIASCKPRFDEFLAMAKLDLIVCVGDVAAKQAKANNWGERSATRQQGKIRVVAIPHPARLLRIRHEDKAKFQIETDRCMIRLSSALAELVPF